MSTRSILLALFAATSLAGLGGGALAQAPVHQVELVAGSCAEPGAVVASLTEALTEADFAPAPAEMSQVADAFGGSLARGHATVPVDMQDLVADGHAVRVYERYRPPGQLVACGEFTGSDRTVSDVQLGLVASEGPELRGVAWLRDAGDGTTTASFVIAPLGATAATVADGEVEVAVRRSLYEPTPLEIEVGTTVTWVNEDARPHTTTATEGAFDSGYMALDDRFSYTFDTPGEYSIFCVYHPRMRAVVIVS